MESTNDNPLVELGLIKGEEMITKEMIKEWIQHEDEFIMREQAVMKKYKMIIALLQERINDYEELISLDEKIIDACLQLRQGWTEMLESVLKNAGENEGV